MKTKTIKLGDGCNLTVTLIDRQGMPLKLSTLKSLVISIVSDMAQDMTFTANSDNTLTILLTHESNLTKPGMYDIRARGELSDGQSFDYTEHVIEVRELSESTDTTFVTSLVLREVNGIDEKEIPDIFRKLGYAPFSAFDDYEIENVVIFGNSLYKFTANHTAGIWNADNVEETSFAELIGQGGTSFEDLGYQPFSATETYAKDDVVIYGGSLYKFTAAHTGAWTGTDATPTSVEELIKEGGGNGHSPYIGDNGNWYEWDDATQQFVDTGTKAQGEDGAQGPQGPQGNTGSSVDYPFELVNNLTTDDATKALSAAQGKVLDGKLSGLDITINGEEAIVIDDFSLLPVTNAAIINNWSTYGDATSWLIEVNPGTNISIDTTGATNTCFLSFLKTNDVVIGQPPVTIDSFADFVASLRTEAGVTLNPMEGRCAMGKDDVLNFLSPADMHYLYVQNLENRIPNSITIGETTEGIDEKIDEIDERLIAVEGDLENIESKLNTSNVLVSTTQGGSYVSMTLDKPIVSGSVIASFNGYTNYVSLRKWNGESFVNIAGFANINESNLPLTLPESCENIIMQVGGEMTITIRGEIYGRLKALESDSVIFADDISMFEGISNGVADNKPDYAYIEIADLHGDWKSLDVCKELRRKNPTIPIFSPGDYNLYNPKSGGVENPQVEEYMSMAAELGIFHCVGQHECGFSNSSAGLYGALNKSEQFTHQEVFEHYIEPMKASWGMPDLNTIYYYKDFVDSKLRLISLYDFNTPLVDDPDDNTKILYPRSNVWYGTEQLSWLISTLNSVPDGYHVIIMTHICPDKNIYNAYNSPFYSFGANGSVDKIVDGTPLIDIVNAYKNRETINTSYMASDTDMYPSSLFTETANGDFTNAKGVFDYFLVGDGHMDTYGKLAGTDLNAIMIVSSGQPYDMVFGDYGKTKTSVTVHAGWHKANNTTNLVIGKIGQNVSILGQDRRCGNIVLTR